jgi:serine/threonine protein kinase
MPPAVRSAAENLMDPQGMRPSSPSSTPSSTVRTRSRASFPSSAEYTLSLGETVLDEVTRVRYRTVRRIGRGSMGEVYEVIEETTGRHLALKCLRLSRIDDPTIVERTRQEGVVLKLLKHKHVVPVYAMGVRDDDGLIWMVMKLLAGCTARQLLRACGRVPLSWALTILREVSWALVAVHEFAVHRDIKPDNIYFDRETASTYLLDFGVCKFRDQGLRTTGGYTIGTVAYMSPEQLARPETVDHRSDIFSAGMVLFQLVSGQHPFVTDADLGDARTVGNCILHRPVRPLAELAPGLPQPIVELVERALMKDREERYTDARQFHQVLNAALQHLEVVLGQPPSPLTDLAAALPSLVRSDGSPTAEAPAVVEGAKVEPTERRPRSDLGAGGGGVENEASDAQSETPAILDAQADPTDQVPCSFFDAQAQAGAERTEKVPCSVVDAEPQAGAERTEELPCSFIDAEPRAGAERTEELPCGAFERSSPLSALPWKSTLAADGAPAPRSPPVSGAGPDAAVMPETPRRWMRTVVLSAVLNALFFFGHVLWFSYGRWGGTVEPVPIAATPAAATAASEPSPAAVSPAPAPAPAVSSVASTGVGDPRSRSLFSASAAPAAPSASAGAAGTAPPASVAPAPAPARSAVPAPPRVVRRPAESAPQPMFRRPAKTRLPKLIE